MGGAFGGLPPPPGPPPSMGPPPGFGGMGGFPPPPMPYHAQINSEADSEEVDLAQEWADLADDFDDWN